jgi:GT2 family glycosyltransferase
VGLKIAIVVSANRRRLLKANLPSLTMQSLPFDRIIVVDNGSRDGTFSFCSGLPGVEVLKLKQNVGFAYGNNIGLMTALADTSVGQISLINNDVRLEANWHAEATAALESNPRCGSVSSCLLKADTPNVVDTAGIIWPTPSRPENYLSGERLPTISSEPRAVFGACAGAALYRRSFFETVGLFDSSLFAYQEDVDLALRGQAAGWRCLFAPGAIGWHLGFGSNRPFPLGGTYADFFNSRNRLAVLIQSLPGEHWQKHWLTILAGEFRSAVRSIREGRGPAVIAGLTQSLVWVPGRIRRRRKQLRIRHLIPNLSMKRVDDTAWSGVAVGMIVKNAVQTLPAAIATIPSKAEFLVADGGSRDGSQLLAKAAGAITVYQDPAALVESGDNFDIARNQLTNAATKEWILFLDSDERLTSKVRAEIAALVSSMPSISVYSIPRINLFWGRPVRLLGQDRQVRLFRRGSCRWVGEALHQPPVAQGSTGRLTSPLLHYNVIGWGDLLGRFKRYLPVEFKTRRGPFGLFPTMILPWRFFCFYAFHQ